MGVPEEGGLLPPPSCPRAPKAARLAGLSDSLAARPAGIDGLCPEEQGVLEGPGQAGHQLGAGEMGRRVAVGRGPGALAWRIALNKTKSLVVSVREGCVQCPAMVPCHCLHDLFVWLHSPLFKREKFLLRSY